MRAQAKTVGGRLEELEKIVAQSRSLEGFYPVGKALRTICTERLYRLSHRRFEAYCRERWDLSARAAYQLITASAVVDNVRNCAEVLPANEAQARPLTRLSPELQRLVWERVVRDAPSRVITAKFVRKVASLYQGQDAKGKNELGGRFCELLGRIHTGCQGLARYLEFVTSREVFVTILQEAQEPLRGRMRCHISLDSGTLSFEVGARLLPRISVSVHWGNEASRSQQARSVGRSREGPGAGPREVPDVGPDASEEHVAGPIVKAPNHTTRIP